MGAAPQLVDNKVLRGLVPLDGLSPHNFSEVVARLQIKEIDKGQFVFKQGEHDINAVYLIEGKIELQQNGKKTSVIRAGSQDAAYALAPEQPRPRSALAKTRVTIAVIDKTLLEVYAGGGQQQNAYEVHDINSNADDDDWMTRLLQSDAFLRLPPMNIQRMLTRMESVQLSANDTVIKQGDEGDAYYTIKYGRCRVTRRDDNGNDVVLAELGDGACFGEDALLSESTRSATITMTTDGELMRLSKKDFLELLNDPLVDQVSYSDAIKLIEQGAKWLDTRSNAEHGAQRIRDSQNIPLPELRDRFSELDSNTTYIAYCNDGRTSAAATFVLGQNGIESRALSNGMATVDTTLIEVVNKTIPAPEETVGQLEAEEANGTIAEAHSDEHQSAEIIGFEEPLGAKHIAEIKKLRGELNNLRKLSETRLTHSKLKAHEQIEKLQSKLKQTVAVRSDEQERNLNEIERLKAALVEEQQNAAALSTSKFETENALTKMLEQVRALTDSNQEHERTIQSTQSKVEELEQAKQLADDKAEQLKTQLDEAIASQSNSENEQQQKIAELNTQLASASDNIKEVEAQLQQAQDALDSAKNDAQNANEQLEENKRELERINAKFEETSTAQRHAEQEVAMLHGKLEGNIQANEEVVAKLKEQLEQASNEHQQTREERESLKTQLSVTEQQLTEKQETVNNFAADLETKRLDIENLNAEKEQALADKASLIDELESLKSTLNDTNKNHEARVKELTTSIDDSHRSSQALEQDNNELKLKLKEAACENERLKVSIEGEIDAEVARLLEEVKAKSSELTSLQSELNSSQKHSEELENRINTLGEQLKENQESYQQNIDELNTALDAAKQASESAQSASNDHQKTLAQLDDQLSAKESELQSSQARLSELELEINTHKDTQSSLEGKVSDLEQARHTLEDQVSTYETEIASLKAAQGDQGELAQRIELLSNENNHLKDTLSNVEENLNAANSQLEIAQSQSQDLGNESEKLKQTVSELETAKLALEEKLSTFESTQEDNSDLQQKIDELEQAKQSLEAELENKQGDDAETARKLKEFEQEKSILIEKIGNTEETIESLRNEVKELSDQNSAVNEDLEASRLNSQKALDEATLRLKQANDEHATQISELQKQLDAQIDDHQKTNSTLEDIHANYRTERLDLETQLHEQTLLKEQANAERDANKLEVEGLRAELESLTQQLSDSADSTSSPADTEQLQRLSSDLAKAVEYRKQSEIAKQALQDEVTDSRKEIARLKGENDGHLELRIQLEGQLAILRQQMSANPAANEIIDNIKNLTDGNNITSMPTITDIGQTSWETKPRKRFNLFMVMAIVLAFILIGLGSWLFKEELGLEDEWQLVMQQLNLSQEPEKTKKTAPKTDIATLNTVTENQPVNTDNSEGGGKATAATKAATPAKVSNPAVTSAPQLTQTESLIAVTPTSRDVTPVPFRVYRNALKDGGASPVMVEMPEGNFTMGSSVTSDYFEERPHRDVKIERFAISKHEVTFAEYEKFAKATRREIPDDEGWGRDDQPAINVSWQDAVSYTTWLSEQTGHTYRLPSEAEWEYVARAGTQASYWWGNEPRGEYANCHDCEGKLAGKQPLSVESFEANPFGVKNSAGNVAEWVQDCYHSSYENAPVDGKAWVTNGQCNKRMVRGGSFRSNLHQLRSSARDSFEIGTRNETIGFRVVREY